MSGADFLDSNVLVYAYDANDARKKQIAQRLVLAGIAGAAVTSPQALAEFCAVLMHKWNPPVRAKDLLAILDVLGPIPVVRIDADTVRRAVEARQQYGVHFYDGMIVAAAEQAGCTRIWSEDLNPGQKYFDVVVENPFT